MEYYCQQEVSIIDDSSPTSGPWISASRDGKAGTVAASRRRAAGCPGTIARRSGEPTRPDEEIEALPSAYRERVKELGCMYAVVRAIHTCPTPEALFHKVAGLIPVGWQYPEITRGKVRFDGAEYVAEPFEETEWNLVSDIVVEGDCRGQVEVYYLQGCAARDEGPFLREERSLVDGIAGALGGAIARYQVQERLSESEEKYRNLFEHASDSIFIIDPETRRFLEVNENAATRLGYGRDELLQLTVDDLDGPSSALRNDAIIQQLLETGSAKFEHTHMHRDGTEMPVEISSKLIEYGDRRVFLSIVRDIRERREAEAALREERDRAQSYLDIAGTILVAIDAAQRVTLLNRKGCQILGYEEKEIIGRNWFDTFIPSDHRADVKATFAALMRGEVELAEHYENPVVTRSGEERIISWHNTLLLGSDDTIIGTLSSGRDVTEHKRADERIRQSLQEKEVLLRELYHRVKNNLQVISSLLRLQSRAVREPAAVRVLEENQARIRAMALAHEKLYQSENLARVGFLDYVKDLVETLIRANTVSRQHITVRIRGDNLPVDLGQAIFCGLLVNELVSNVFKHAFPDGRPGEIEVVVREVDSDWMELSVRDNGVGIPPDLDFRGVQSLGLQLVRTLAEEQLRGAVDLDRDDGTQFRIRLPKRVDKLKE
jgi:PAS domain S-box-containing protein